MQFSKTLKAISLALFASSSYAQADQLDNTKNWQTFETENFRVHFTPEYEKWALSSAREMEAVRTLVEQQQGRVLSEKVDAYIIDPLNAANGFAVPLSHKPYMALFATPPMSDSVISNSTGWQQLLVLHEYVHLVHLAQKSRSNIRSKIAGWYDLYDASQIKGERWVAEGYATLLESKMTGRGRLYNNYVESILQQFARQGALPSYSQLSNINNDFMSGSMAYLVGVRYLQWLEENYGEDTLDAVWTRWTAVKNRTFNQAFNGVFPQSAKSLYQRFIAEYTHQALQKEAHYPEIDSNLWLDLSGYVSAPSISPNGEHLAVVEKTRNDEETKVSLHVYKTEENAEAKKEFNEEVAKILKDDPKDIAAKAPKVFKRKQAYSLHQTNSRGINDPRWLDDDHIVYRSTSLSSANEFHQDLFIWQLSSNTVTQLTREQNLRRFDIADNGQTIYAERNRYGKSQLVKLSLNTNKEASIESELTAASLHHVYDFPRISPDQQQLAYLVSSLNNKWSLKIKNILTGKIATVPVPENYQFLSFPEWAKDGKSIFFVAGLDQQTKLYQYDFTVKELSSLTSGEQPITWPVFKDENELLHLAINDNGPDIYQLAIDNANKTTITDTTTNASVTSSLASSYKLEAADIIVDSSIGEQSNYGVGPQQGTITLGGNFYSASSTMLELGYKSGDVLGRFDWQAHISQDFSSNILSGGSASVRWHGWPVKLLAHGYQFKLKTNQQFEDAINLGHLKERGLFFEASYPMQFETLKLNGFVQGKVAKTASFDSHYFSVGLQQSWSLDKQNWALHQQFNTTFLQGEDDFSQQISDSSYQGNNGEFDMNAHFKGYGLGVSYLWANRSSEAGNILSLGGYSASLIQEKAHLNKLLTPELAFYSQQANDYEQMQAYIPVSIGKVFYRRHKMDKQEVIDSYGFTGTIHNDFGFTGITDLVINYGVAQVNPENQKSDTQGWIGISHQF
ncbi:TolB family protein [Litorilituus lipolyticus]|uniref:Uncharacterized protein n=1 Tax=Litorilituus lipolyticus TaxID=2491017 RepID=A0A502KT95_9GAMM|nr:hypothetical protein [Litorilituus lipolyticus]TPH13221.1 hypothetical protein EPA86_13585 [Litorilituus lipolyticus]